MSQNAKLNMRNIIAPIGDALLKHKFSKLQASVTSA